GLLRVFFTIPHPVSLCPLPRRNFVMWAFAALLVLAAGMFPLQAILGQGASEAGHRSAFLGVLALVIALTVLFTRGFHWQVASLLSPALLGPWGYHFPPIA